jgi:DNA-binding beta-propeller fold protein YncE
VNQRRLIISALAAAAALLVPPAAEAKLRDVLVVSNNWAGTADVIDLGTFQRVKRLNVVPDRARRIAEIRADPARSFAFDGIRALIGEGHDQLVDDGFPSKDGRRIFFSRPSFADVVAIDVASGRIAWRVAVGGVRADHMALSPNGRRLLVSASTANVVDVIDTRRGRIVGRFPSGDSPHESNFSRDGRRIYHASIGFVYTSADDPSQDASKGRRVFEIVDARTLKVRRRIDMGRELARYGLGASSAVRPMAIAPDERYVYLQLSFLHGFVEYDLKARRPTRIALLPLSRASRRLERQDYLLDSAQHGLSFNPRGTRLCAAGTMSSYAAIVSRRTLRPLRIVHVGRVPYWSTASPDGRFCFVSVAGDDRVAVLSFRTGRLVRYLRVGDHPQRMRTGRLKIPARSGG